MTTSQHHLPLSRENLARFSDRLYEAVRREVPAYAAIVDPAMDLDFKDVIQENLRLFFRCLAEDRQPTSRELAVVELSARRRLRQAIPLEAIFHSYRVGVRVMWECVLEVAPQRDHGRLAARALEYADRVSTAAAQAYLEERQHLAQSRQEASRLLLTRVLREEVDESAAISEASSLGLDLSRPHAVLVAAAAHDELRPTTSSDMVLAAVYSRLLSDAPGAPALLLSSGLVIAAPVAALEAVEELVATALAAAAGAGPTFRALARTSAPGEQTRPSSADRRRSGRNGAVTLARLLRVGRPRDEALATEATQIVRGLPAGVGLVQQVADDLDQVAVTEAGHDVAEEEQGGQDRHHPWVPEAERRGMKAVALSVDWATAGHRSLQAQ